MCCSEELRTRVYVDMERAMVAAEREILEIYGDSEPVRDGIREAIEDFND